MILEESTFPTVARTVAALVADAEGVPPSAARQSKIAGLLEEALAEASLNGLPDVCVCAPNVAEVRTPDGGLAYVCLTRAEAMGIAEAAADALAIAKYVPDPDRAASTWGDPRRWHWSIAGRELGAPKVAKASTGVFLSFPDAGEGWAPPAGRNVTLTVSAPPAWEFEMVVTQMSTQVVRILGEPTFGNRRGGPSMNILLSMAEGVRK